MISLANSGVESIDKTSESSDEGSDQGSSRGASGHGDRLPDVSRAERLGL
jgi:hypothetical protein